jgi:hypothetical protein
MTDRVQPGAIDSIIRNDELAQVFGQFSEGWIVKPSSQPTPAAVRRPEIDETALNGFSLVSTSGFDVTIDAGEGFVGGWCARDVPTTVSVPANATSTVVLAWSLDAIFDPNVQSNRDLADEVRVDLAQNVDNQYPTTELFDVTAGSISITGTTDRRRLGPTVVADQLTTEDSLTDPAGVTHTGELADNDNPVTDFNVGNVADGEFIQNNGGSLTGSIGNISAKAELSSQQSIADATLTDVNLETVIVEQDAAIVEVDTTANEMVIKEPGVYTVAGNIEFTDKVNNCTVDFVIKQDGVERLTRSLGTVPGFTKTLISDSISTLFEVTAPPTSIAYEIFQNNGNSRAITSGTTALTITKQN